MTQLMPTVQAAAIYGCHRDHLPKLCKRHGLRPSAVKVYEGRTYFFWHPAAVLELRRRIKRYSIQRRIEARARRPKRKLTVAERNILRGIERRKAKRESAA